MNLFLFKFDIHLAFILAFIFIFVAPILIIKLNKKPLTICYLFTYLLLLFLGVLLDVSIDNNSISFSLLITSKWFNNKLSIAYFDTLLIFINILLLFPLGTIFPLLKKNKLNNYLFSLIIGFSTSLLIEFLQFSLPIIRYGELLDIINNTFSVILGYQYYLLINYYFIRSEKNDRISKQKSNNSDK